jgi:hypothetical protein
MTTYKRVGSYWALAGVFGLLPLLGCTSRSPITASTPAEATSNAEKTSQTAAGNQKQPTDSALANTTKGTTASGSGARRTPIREELAKLPLIKQDDLRYLGGFRLPGGKQGVSSFDYGGSVIAFNSARESLFVVGHDWQQAVGEISIPTSLSSSKHVRDLPVAKCLQSFVDIRSRIPKNDLQGTIKIGGLLVHDGRMTGSLYVYYDADGSAKDSHFQLDSLDLMKAKVQGLFRVGTMGGGWVGGYMASVPEEWQGALGARYLTGQAALPIISRTSFGPAAFGFDPQNLGSPPAPATPYVYYTQAKPLGNIDTKNPFFNGTTEIKGLVFPPGTRSALFFGSHGTGDVVYGEESDANDPHRGDKGYHSRDGKYEYQVWAYDVNDFVAVRSGKVQPWQVKPYAVWHLGFPIDVPAKRVGGIAFDPSTNRLFFSQLHADEWGLPLIHVFKLSAS